MVHHRWTYSSITACDLLVVTRFILYVNSSSYKIGEKVDTEFQLWNEFLQNAEQDADDGVRTSGNQSCKRVYSMCIV